jgi:endonuclease/exonuclease/phosphatase family metal-dependent hydrolase
VVNRKSHRTWDQQLKNYSPIVAALLVAALTLPAHGHHEISAASVRLMTLNVAHARATGRNQMMQSEVKARVNLNKIAAVINREQPDIVAFQEIDNNSFWNGRFNHGQFIAEKTNFNHWFTGSHQLSNNLDYGTGLMSKFSLTDPLSVTFKKPFARTRKGFVLSTIDWPNSKGVKVDLVSLHLDFLSRSQRRKEIDTLIRTLYQRDNLLIIMGDFNTEYEEQALLHQLSSTLNLHTWLPDEDELVTYPKLGRRLDWVLVSQAFEFNGHQVLKDSLSDHQAVIVDITLRHEQLIPYGPEYLVGQE